jgi:predicted nucleotide-binding protein (sugar kinase/HSP70/actin superfamily)
MAKYLGCCRLPHYATILRKALDDAGFENVAIMTNDDVDYHELHPGFKISATTMLRVSISLPMIDTLEEILRKNETEYKEILNEPGGLFRYFQMLPKERSVDVDKNTFKYSNNHNLIGDA